MIRILPLLLVLAGSLPALAGSSIFLVARADMPDPNFHDTVILLVRPDSGPPVGVIVNRPTPIAIGGFFPEIENIVRGDEKVHIGGPVARQAVILVFKADTRPDDAEEVMDGVYMASNRKLLHEILSGERKVDGLRVFLGYAGWAPEQLEEEIDRGDWHVARSDARSIFEKPAARLWSELNSRASLVPARYAPR
jgi:putative transcriptional regulator